MEVPFHEMGDLTIESENNLETLWHRNDALPSNSFSKLQNICIGKSHRLTYLFPSRFVRLLVFLNTLKVSNCELLERIFEIDRDQVTSTDEDARAIPLRKLSLDRLPSLESIWTNDPGELLTFPNLKEVEVAACPRLKSVFPASFVKHVEGIESLSTNGETEIFAEDNEASKVVLFPEMVLFPSLRSLGIHRKVVKKGIFWVKSAESFPKLQRLCLFGSEDEGNMVTLPLEMSEVLYKIEELKIEKAFELVQVFQNKHYDCVQSGAKLKRLDLYDLRKLTHVWEVETEADKKYDDEMIVTTSVDAFDSLERIEVRECESLKCILPSSITFFNLTYLEVSDCDEMTSLVSSTVAKNLVSLETMKILGCEGMSSIVMIAEGEEEIVFKKMKCLKVFNLPRLASFGSSENGQKCTLKFPDLETLSIKRCPKMKTFSYGGMIDTPKLTFLITEEGYIPVSEAYGINDIIQILLTNDQGEEDDTEEDEEE